MPRKFKSKAKVPPPARPRCGTCGQERTLQGVTPATQKLLQRMLANAQK